MALSDGKGIIKSGWLPLPKEGGGGKDTFQEDGGNAKVRLDVRHKNSTYLKLNCQPFAK